MTNLGGGAEAHAQSLVLTAHARTITDEGVYEPKTKETRAAYEIMLNFIERRLGFQHVRAAAKVMLAILKNDRLLNIEKKEKIDKLLNPISYRTFRALDSIGELLTDYQVAPKSRDDDFDNEFGDSSDEDDESDCDTVLEDEDVVEPTMGAGIGDEDMYDANESMNLNVEDIDVYWVQRRILEAYEQAGLQIHPVDCHILSEEVLKILDEGDDAEVKMKLLKLKYLGLKMFSLIKFLICNRLKIVWCTRLARAENEVERKMVEDKMVGLGSDVTSILAELQAKRESTKESRESLNRTIIEEARRLGMEASCSEGRLIDSVALDLEAGLLLRDGEYSNSQIDYIAPDAFV